MKNIVSNLLSEHINVVEAIKNDFIISNINLFSKLCIKTLKNNGTIFFMGNGGSAADSQHIASELVGKFKGIRKAYPAIAITTDTSSLTSIANDYGFNKIFSRQIQALVNKGDTVVGISTSGNSENIIEGIVEAKKIGAYTVGLLGKNGGKLKDICDLSIIVPSNITARVQEVHILIGHIVCELLEKEL